jgi:hypothetical protein
MIRKVAFVGDFLRFEMGSYGLFNFQNNNLSWLSNILGSTVSWNSLGIESKVFKFDASIFFQTVNNDLHDCYMKDPKQAWADLYDGIEPSLDEIISEICSYDLVVGFELPPIIKRRLNLADIEYISFHIHPIRFLRDLTFSVMTNSPWIASFLESNVVLDSEIYQQIKKYKALFGRINHPSLSIPDNIPVLIGQTDTDSALLKEGKFVGWNDYDEQLAGYLDGYDEVIFLEHPYGQSNFSVIENLRCKHGKTVIPIRVNSYGIIFSENNIPFFLSLSSSLGVEAETVGHKSIFLLADPRDKFTLKEVDQPLHVMVSHAVLLDRFWLSLFSRNKLNIFDEDSFFLGDNYLRHSLESWAFKAIESGCQLDYATKTILPSSSLSEEKLLEIQAKLCGDNNSNGSLNFPWGKIIALQPPLTHNNTMKFNFSTDGIDYYLEGFHASESWGVWSNGKSSSLRFSVMNEQEKIAKISIRLRIKIFEPLLSYSPVLRISHDRELIQYVLFRILADNEQEIEFMIESKSHLVKIDFELTHQMSPAEHGSQDNRILGFALTSFFANISNLSISEVN